MRKAGESKYVALKKVVCSMVWVDTLEQISLFMVRPRMQATLLIASIALMAGMTYYYAYYVPVVLESTKDLIPITPNTIKKWGADPTVVKTGMRIINFPEFNVLTRHFVCDAILWFDFDPSLVSLDTLAKFSFDRGTLLKISAPSTNIIGERVFAKYTIRLEFTSPLNYARFPFDDHRINIALTNIYLSPKDIVFDANRLGFDLSGDMLEWYPMELSVQAGYTEISLDKTDASKAVRYPQVVFSIDFRRIGIKQLLVIFLPLFAIFFTALLTFCFDPNDSLRTMIGASSGAISAMIGYRFVMQEMSPKIGYFLFSDYIFIIFMVLEGLQFFLVIVMAMHLDKKRLLNIIRGMYIVFVYVVLIGAWYRLITQS